MILYKYRSLANFEHILDIILNQRLHCSTYPELNDPFEGIFVVIISPHYNKGGALARWIARRPRYKNAKELYGDAMDEIKICSLSSNLSDVRLWSYYADGHKGIVFEIDFSGLETNIYEVKYSKELPRGGISRIARGAILSGQTNPPRPYEMFSRKTWHWDTNLSVELLIKAGI